METINFGVKFESRAKFLEALTSYSLKKKTFNVNKRPDYLAYQGVGGVPIAWDDNEKLVFMDSSDAHTLIVGATGSKKSRLLAMPTVKLLGEADESMIICDPKGEIYERTAAELYKNDYCIKVVNLRNPQNGHAWNPFYIPFMFFQDEVLIDKAYEFINDISYNVMLSDVSKHDPFWDYASSDFFFGLTLLLFKFCKEYDLQAANISNLLALRREILTDGRVNAEIWNYAKKDTVISASLIGTMEAHDGGRRSIAFEFDSKLRTFSMQPNLITMLSDNEIDFDSVGDKKTAIFLLLPDEKTSYHRIVSMFVKQSYEYFIYKAQSYPERRMPIRINYVLDEFSALPTIKDFPNMITAARSRNIRFNLFVQSEHQLVQRYRDEAATIKSNCSNWVFLTSRELSLLQELSTLCGQKEDGRPLVSISSLQHLDKELGEALVISGRLKPIKSKLPDIKEYDKDSFAVLEYPIFKNRILENIEFEELINKTKQTDLENLKSEEKHSNAVENSATEKPDDNDFFEEHFSLFSRFKINQEEFNILKEKVDELAILKANVEKQQQLLISLIIKIAPDILSDIQDKPQKIKKKK